ncbi:MAG: ribosomal protein S18-alanine N-acetyltransferase [Rhodobiaceae bacterium]|nr:ribosomal protein S18-alanine N-acetyltransferase [Rhodobiaceae bacterium]
MSPSPAPAETGSIAIAATLRAAEIAALHARSDAPAWSVAAWSAQLAQPAVACLVHETASRIDGFIALAVAAGEAEVLMIAVDPPRRRRGIAGRLLSAALRAVRAKGARTCFLEVADDNAPARALYAAHGFREIGRRKGYYARSGDSVDALMLAASLNDMMPPRNMEPDL